MAPPPLCLVCDGGQVSQPLREPRQDEGGPVRPSEFQARFSFHCEKLFRTKLWLPASAKAENQASLDSQVVLMIVDSVVKSRQVIVSFQGA